MFILSQFLSIPLSFLDKNEKYEATIYFQDEKDLKNNRIKSEKLTVHQNSVLSRKLLANSGLAVIIKKEL